MQLTFSLEEIFQCFLLDREKFMLYIVTPHAQRERGKVIGRGVHIYIYMSVDEKKI